MNAHASRTDFQLVELAQLGDEQAFEELFERYYSMVYRFAYQYLGNGPDAEDVLQESFVRAARSIDKFKMESKFSTWLYQITLNCAKDLGRKRKRGKTITEILKSHHEIDRQTNHVENAEVLQALQGLPEKQRRSIVLSYYHGLNHAEIAEVLQCAEKTISWYLNKARANLKKIIEQQLSKEES